MMITPKLKTLRLCVNDLAASKKFYQQLFGLPVHEEDGNYVSFDFAGTRLEMVAADDKNPASTGGSIGYFEVSSVTAVIEKAQLLGATIWRGPLKVNDNGWTIVQIKDSAGNIIGFEGQSS